MVTGDWVWLLKSAGAEVELSNSSIHIQAEVRATAPLVYATRPSFAV